MFRRCCLECPVNVQNHSRLPYRLLPAMCKPRRRELRARRGGRRGSVASRADCPGGRRRASRDRLRRGGGPLGAAGGSAGRTRDRPRRRRDDADRQPPRVGLRDGRLLAPRRGGPAVHRAAALVRPSRAHGAGGSARGRRRRARPRHARANGLRRRDPGSARRSPARWLRAGARGAARPRGPGADRLHLRDLGGAQADPARRALPRGSARAGRALVRRPRRRPVLVHRCQRMVTVGPQCLRRRVAARRRRGAAGRPLRPRRAPGGARARARRRALHVPHGVPRDRQALRAGARLPRSATPSRPASRSTPRWCERGRRASGWRSTTATARPRPAT